MLYRFGMKRGSPILSLVIGGVGFHIREQTMDLDEEQVAEVLADAESKRFVWDHRGVGRLQSKDDPVDEGRLQRDLTDCMYFEPEAVEKGGGDAEEGSAPAEAGATTNPAESEATEGGDAPRADAPDG